MKSKPILFFERNVPKNSIRSICRFTIYIHPSNNETPADAQGRWAYSNEYKPLEDQKFQRPMKLPIPICFAIVALILLAFSQAYSDPDPVNLSADEARKAKFDSLFEVSEVVTRRYSIPEPATTLTELEEGTENLGTILPELGDLLEANPEPLSPLFASLYEAKTRSGTTLQNKKDKWMNTKKWFDCRTILKLSRAGSDGTNHKLMLFQSDMQSVTDGTDPIRKNQLADYEEGLKSSYFQDLTSYRWEHPGAHLENPFYEHYAMFDDLHAEIDRLAPLIEGNKDLQYQIRLLYSGVKKAADKIKKEQSYLANTRSLLAEHDPFIVLPKNWLGEDSEGKILADWEKKLGEGWTPRRGDFAIVICDGKVIPAIVGEAGPVYEIGEASLKVGRVINPKASGRISAVDDLRVTYLVFPQSRNENFGVPEIDDVRAACERELANFGGLGDAFSFHSW